MKIEPTDHLGWEILHARKVGHRPGEAPPLGPTDPVPWCECATCRLLRYAEFPGLAPGVFDVVRVQVLPELARIVPIERTAAAIRLRREWREAAEVELPPADLLAELATSLPGARKAPRPVPDDRAPLPVDEARQVPILEVCDRLGIELRRVGRSYRGRCPFHDSKSGTSFVVNPGRGWYCFSCSIGGDGIALLERAKGLDFAGAVKELAS